MNIFSSLSTFFKNNYRKSISYFVHNTQTTARKSVIILPSSLNASVFVFYIKFRCCIQLLNEIMYGFI